MEAHVDQIVNWILSLSPFSIYAIFTFIAYVENIVPPIPGDILIVFGGYLAAEQVVGFPLVLTLTTVASVVGFMNMYAFGLYFGAQIETHRSDFWLMRFVDVKYFDRCKRWMHKYGQAVIVANRFLAGTRSVISLTAGLTRMRPSTTLLSSFVSSLAWNFILLALGWIVNENWQMIGNYLNIYGWAILFLLAILIGGRLLYRRYKKRNVGQSKNSLKK